jgi:sugar phosphate isomerase/epimerase
MYLSIFTDELKIPDTAQTLATLAGWGYEYVDFRGLVFGKAIDSLDQNELAELKQMLAKHNLKVGCLQSSLAKVHLPDQERRAVEAQKLEGLIRAADALDCRLIRAFNYWQPQHAASRHVKCWHCLMH